MAIDSAATEQVRRAQAGDLRAFEQLFAQYQRGIYNTIYQMVRNESDAADLTQDVFVRAYRALPKLQSPEAFTSWLYRIAVNLSRNFIRDTTRVRVESLEKEGDSEEESSQREIADTREEPGQVAQTRDMQDRVRAAVATLSADHRTVVTMHHLQGMSVEEIAKVMGCSVGTVKSRLSRARDHLRRKLDSLIDR